MLLDDDTAHRAARLHSFALLLAATFVELGGWTTLVDLPVAGALAFFFFIAVVSCMIHGLCRDTHNQLRDPLPGTHRHILVLIVAGFAIVFAGFRDARVL